MLDIINAINEYECEWPDLTGMKGILLNPVSGNYNDWTKPTFADMDTENWVLCCVEEQFHLCMDMLTGDPLELVKWKEGLNAKPVTSPTFPENSIECLLIVNGNKGAVGFIEYRNELGVLFRYFDNNLCDFLIFSDCDFSFEPLPAPIELVDGFAYQFTYVNNNKKYHGIYNNSQERFLFIDGHVMSSYCKDIQLLEVKS
ncbi:MAG TPA: hypothetical protein EYN67_13785 [Flavobacteriales bacterium]|nr:hypothetical protein [Flavobacteriales bacterium]